MSINRMVASSQIPRADQRAGYKTIILAHMIREKLGAERLSKASCLGFGLEGLDFVTDALVSPVSVHFGFGWKGLANVWPAAELCEAQFSGLQALASDGLLFLRCVEQLGGKSGRHKCHNERIA